MFVRKQSFNGLGFKAKKAKKEVISSRRKVKTLVTANIEKHKRNKAFGITLVAKGQR